MCPVLGRRGGAHCGNVLLMHKASKVVCEGPKTKEPPVLSIHCSCTNVCHVTLTLWQQDMMMYG